MPGLSDRKIEIVRHLVESAPDKIVGGLQNALAAASGDSVLAGVRRLVESEVADRRLRNAVLSPIAPLCVAGAAEQDHIRFPSRVLALIWRGLKETCPTEVLKAERTLADYRADETSTEPFDILVTAAADALRERQQRDFAAAADLADASREGGAELLLSCLALSPIIREAILRLPDWISRTTDERAAAARLAYKDAVVISDDAGPRFFEMLAAQLAEPWTILRIVSAVMDRPTEHYLAASEFSVFAEQLMDELGYYEQPAYVLGMLMAKLFRACRIVADIGMHLELPIPETFDFHPGEVWSWDLTVELLSTRGFVERAFAESEATRYLGWPGQAISYKVGERVILELRDEARARLGSAFDLRAFHEAVLSAGSVGLDHLRDIVRASVS